MGWLGEPVRVLAATNRKRARAGPWRVPANARLVEWLSYARTMPQAALVICHAGHGTLARALASGCPVLAVPHSATWARTPPGSTGPASASGCRGGC